MSDTPWQGKTVLIADDSEISRKHLETLYQNLGMTVAGSVKNGLEALDFLEGKTPDLVSLDINMPEMDGIECYKRITKKSPEQKIAMVSWLLADPDLAESLHTILPTNITGSKPIDQHQLETLLKNVYGVSTENKMGTPHPEMPYAHKVS